MNFLSEYELTIKYKPGANSIAADFPSHFERSGLESEENGKVEIALLVSDEKEDLEPHLVAIRQFPIV